MQSWQVTQEDTVLSDSSALARAVLGRNFEFRVPLSWILALPGQTNSIVSTTRKGRPIGFASASACGSIVCPLMRFQPKDGLTWNSCPKKILRRSVVDAHSRETCSILEPPFQPLFQLVHFTDCSAVITSSMGARSF